MMAAMFSGCGSSDADETTKGTTKAVETEKEKTTEEKNTKTETDKETETDSDSDDEEKKYAKADGILFIGLCGIRMIRRRKQSRR